MQRPVMDPMFLREHHESRRHARLAAALATTGSALRWTGRQLLRQPFRLRRKRSLLFDDTTPAGRFARGLVYRLLFVPILLSFAAGIFVFCGTHPRSHPVEADPASQGVFFQSVSYESL